MDIRLVASEVGLLTVVTIFLSQIFLTEGRAHLASFLHWGGEGTKQQENKHNPSSPIKNPELSALSPEIKNLTIG